MAIHIVADYAYYCTHHAKADYQQQMMRCTMYANYDCAVDHAKTGYQRWMTYYTNADNFADDPAVDETTMLVALP